MNETLQQISKEVMEKLIEVTLEFATILRYLFDGHWNNDYFEWRLYPLPLLIGRLTKK